jgi:hypothetical protein
MKIKSILKSAPIILVVLISGFYVARPHSKLLLFVAPPKGLYNPIYNQSISFDESKQVSKFVMNHKYIGCYAVNLYLKKLPALIFEPIISNAEITIEMKVNNKQIYKNKYSNWKYDFSSVLATDKSLRGGANLGYYFVPKDIPMNQDIDVAVSVATPDKSFKDRYGEAILVIQRISDE